jgi:hypothetical protein
MRVLLFIATFGMVLALFGAAVTVAYWAARALFRSVVRLILKAEEAPKSLIDRHREDWSFNPNQFKRAGQ